jgi:hypothetical protein
VTIGYNLLRTHLTDFKAFQGSANEKYSSLDMKVALKFLNTTAVTNQPSHKIPSLTL